MAKAKPREDLSRPPADKGYERIQAHLGALKVLERQINEAEAKFDALQTVAKGTAAIIDAEVERVRRLSPEDRESIGESWGLAFLHKSLFFGNVKNGQSCDLVSLAKS